MNEWTPQEIEVLKKLYNKVLNEELMKAMPNKTPIAIYKKAYALGMRKTRENEFLNRSVVRRGEKGSNWKGGRVISQKGYVMICNPEHHRANKRGYVPEHIVVWEEANNTLVPSGFDIHHINGNKADNRSENLVLLTHAEHTALHNLGTRHSAETKQKIKEKARERFQDPRNHPRHKDVDILQMQIDISKGESVVSVCERYHINKTTYYKKLRIGDYNKCQISTITK